MASRLPHLIRLRILRSDVVPQAMREECELVFNHRTWQIAMTPPDKESTPPCSLRG